MSEAQLPPAYVFRRSTGGEAMRIVDRRIDEATIVARKNQHVVPHTNGWAVRGAGNSRVTSVHETQREATERARDIANNQSSEVLIHGRNGRIRERNSYGNDPSPPEG
ncbi:DUF2188 domain-containing protein [Altererythrobacter palmitatis]